MRRLGRHVLTTLLSFLWALGVPSVAAAQTYLNGALEVVPGSERRYEGVASSGGIVTEDGVVWADTRSSSFLKCAATRALNDGLPPPPGTSPGR
jgi:hypothetical protein